MRVCHIQIMSFQNHNVSLTNISIYVLYLGYIGKKYLNRAMHEVLSKPNPKAPLPLSFSVIRIPFFLEPHYDESRPFIESNKDRHVKKWGGKEGW